MFEAKLLEGNILKKIVEAIKDVVNDVNIDVSPAGKHSSTPIEKAKSLHAICHLPLKLN